MEDGPLFEVRGHLVAASTASISPLSRCRTIGYLLELCIKSGIRGYGSGTARKQITQHAYGKTAAMETVTSPSPPPHKSSQIAKFFLFPTIAPGCATVVAGLWPPIWKDGNVIGVTMDFDQRKIHYFLDGKYNHTFKMPPDIRTLWAAMTWEHGDLQVMLHTRKENYVVPPEHDL